MSEVRNVPARYDRNLDAGAAQSYNKYALQQIRAKSPSDRTAWEQSYLDAQTAFLTK